MMRWHILSLFPDYFNSPFNESMIKKAQEKGLIEIHQINIRDFADNKFRRVDDRPYGGGPGMVMMPQPLIEAIQSVRTDQTRVIYLSPQGKPLNAKKCRELANYEHIVLVCGHYEGIDERVIENEIDEEISIGDYVLTNGCIAAIVVLDAVVRFVPGVIGHDDAASQDSFEQGGRLDCPHYTRPEEYKKSKVPEVLLSGNHQEIAKWRHQKALEKTRLTRPDLLD